MTLSLNKRFSDGWQLQASYTLGDSKDTWSGGQIGGSDFDNGAGSATDWFDPEYEYGPSSFDVRHNFVVNGVYMLPFAREATGVKAFFAKGWQVGGVMQFSSGLPFTPFLGYDQVGDRQSDVGLHKPNLNGVDQLSGIGGTVVRSVGLHGARGRRVRQRDTQLDAYGGSQDRGPLRVQELHVRALSGAVPPRSVQRVQLGELRTT